jgi:hypothetical protein
LIVWAAETADFVTMIFSMLLILSRFEGFLLGAAIDLVTKAAARMPCIALGILGGALKIKWRAEKLS